MKFEDLLEREIKKLSASQAMALRNGGAFWISPNGELIDSSKTYHISMVIANPSKFGLSSDYINRIYAKHGEEIGTEGDAREEVIGELLKRGWVRIRSYRNYWSITVDRFTDKSKSLIRSWVQEMIDIGAFGQYEELRIVEMRGRTHVLSAKDVLNYRLVESIQLVRKNIRELPDLEVDP